MVYKDGALQDTGKGLAKGKFVDGKSIMLKFAELM